MKKVLFGVLAAASLGGFGGSAVAAGLEGDTVTVALTITGFPSFLCANCTASFVVGPGVEGAIYNNTQAVDFGASSFSITSSGSFSQFGFNPAPPDRPVTLRLSSLNLGAPISNVTFSTTLAGPVTRTFGADFAEFVFFDQPVSAGQTYLTAQFVTTPVPEPHSLALMAAGLGGLAAAVRRRRAALQVQRTA